MRYGFTLECMPGSLPNTRSSVGMDRTRVSKRPLPPRPCDDRACRLSRCRRAVSSNAVDTAAGGEGDPEAARVICVGHTGWVGGWIASASNRSRISEQEHREDLPGLGLNVNLIPNRVRRRCWRRRNSRSSATARPSALAAAINPLSVSGSISPVPTFCLFTTIALSIGHPI